MGMKERLFFVGPGRAGLSLGQALVQADAVAELVYCGRRPEPPIHPLFSDGVARYSFGLEPPGVETTAVFLSVPDDALPEMAHALAGQGTAPPGCPAFHLSGALNADVLAPLHARGYAVGTFHVLQSLADPVTAAARIPGSFVSISGEPGAVAAARRLVQHLGSRTLAVPVARRPLYHAAAVLASGEMVSLLALAARLLVRAGVPEEDALPALLPLARGNLDNLERLGLEQALTGPVPRGDVETVRLHLRTLEPRAREVYRLLTLELVDQMELGLEPEVREALQELLEDREGAGT
jgi:predicted short-subunit dehydrogenase-like oxidoreductase (DUF2520 family)